MKAILRIVLTSLLVVAGACQSDDDAPINSADPCAACAKDFQVCVSNTCVNVPAMCPCPRETYCDTEANTCIIGCLDDSHCDLGRICTDSQECRSGCREDSDCGEGGICEGQTCFQGCRDDSDCGPGQLCDSTLCKTGCRQDADCEAGKICDGEICRSGCRSDADCPTLGMVCDGSYCFEGCRDDSGCPSGQACVGGTCAPGCRSDAECTAPGTSCQNNACACLPGFLDCNGSCVDVASDLNHCGGCGIVCAGPGAACVGGGCACNGTSMCPDGCLDTTSDPRNCGGCGVDCGPGYESACVASACVNGSMPTIGMYADCYGGNCLSNDCIVGTTTAACSMACTSADECAPSPGGYAVPGCVTTTLGYNLCVLLCGDAYAIPGVPPCPSGMECFTQSLDPYCVPAP